jgi:DNA-binding CsgD family transcriptional regulator/tetratricopeptide (TPR) repeat protein
MESQTQAEGVYRPKGPGRSTFVGRQREMGKLKGVLEGALSGQGQLLMLVGEPGIGKTRTAQELAAYAETRDAQVLWGWCYEEEGAPPFWPWLQPIRSYIQRRDAKQLQSEMGPGAADIAEVVSEVRGKLLNLDPPPALPPEQARFRLFDSITTFLKNAAQSQPLMLVLDDLHWADKPSLLLLQFLARQLGESHLLVVGCYRDLELSRQHPLSQALGYLSREPVFRRVPLRGLDLEDTEPFIQAITGIRPGQGLAGTIHERTRGNPFFMTEVVRLLSDQGGLTGQEAGGPLGVEVPEGVRATIGLRLSRLSDACNQVLTTAAIIGRGFDFKLLRALSGGIAEAEQLEAIDQALAAHLIQELPGEGERYQFSHVLFQQALVEELSTSRRVRLHARTAEALEKLYGPGAPEHAPELAHHFAQAEPVLGAEKLVQYSLLAGEGALVTYAWEAAEAHFQRGLTARRVPPDGTQPANNAEAAALLYGLGRARAATADRRQFQKAVDIIGRAFDYYEAAGDVARATAVAEYPLPPLPQGRTGAARFVSRALALVAADSHAAGRLLSGYSAELGRLENDYAGSQEASRRALAIARRENDVSLEIRTLAAAADVDLFHLHLQDSVEKAEKAIELARELDDPQAGWLAHHAALKTLWVVGESRAAQQHGSASLGLAEKQRDRYRLDQALRVGGILHRLLGDWSRAREFSDRGLAVAAQDTMILVYRVQLEYEVGDSAAGGGYLERLLETIPRELANRPGSQYAFPALVIPWIARITGRLDLLAVAESSAQTTLSSSFANPLFVLSAKAGLGLLAVLRADQAAAEEQYKALEPWQGLMLMATSSDHVLGLLAHTMGNLDRAVEHFEDAVAFCRKAGYRPALAWSYHDCAETLLQSSSTSDLAKALSLLEESLAISTDLGMRPLMERVVAMQERVHSQPAKASAYPDGLTQREVEVLRLVASGQSSAEIAAELVLSRRTVERHISNIYSKTNTSNRSEATAFAFTHGLIPTG